MSWLSQESGYETSQPREALELITSAVTHRVCTGSRDITISGQAFRASPGGRGEVGVFITDKQRELEIQLPIAHAFCQRYFGGTSPPRQVLVNAYRVQATDVKRIWQGRITSGAIDGHVARFGCPSAFEEMLARRLPTVSAGRQCPHVLYDSRCLVARASFRVVTTVALVSGNTVTVASMGGNPSQYAQHGELVVTSGPALGERMTVVTQVGTEIVLQLPIDGLASGNTVEVYAGCSHLVQTCDVKFDNVANFGGLPRQPRGNIFLPTGTGIYQSEE